MCIIYMLFYTAFITKYFQILGEMVHKNIENEEMFIFFEVTPVMASWFEVFV